MQNGYGPGRGPRGRRCKSEEAGQKERPPAVPVRENGRENGRENDRKNDWKTTGRTTGRGSTIFELGRDPGKEKEWQYSGEESQ